MNKNKEFEDYIETVYDFKTIWKEKCSVYNISEQPSVLPPCKRIIVLGDIHGDLKMAIKMLRIGKVINKQHKWIGGDTIVVQVGDQVDRCRYSGVPCNQKDATDNDEGNDWYILQYFTRLHHLAQKDGGAVYSLIGNHELMNVNGDFRYVSHEGLNEFKDYKVPVKYTYSDDNVIRDGDNVIRDGEEARRWAFKPGNPVSDFLACTRQIALIIGSNLFVHAGVLPKIAKKYSVKTLNELMSLYLFDMLKDKSKYYDVFNAADVSPLWNRTYGNMGLNKIEDEKVCTDIMQPLKDIYQVDRIFVGHTPIMENGMTSVCNKKIWLTDFGASKAFDKFDKNLNKKRMERRLKIKQHRKIIKNKSGVKILDDYFQLDYSSSSDSDSENSRSNSRRAQVLEILDDGKKINILK